MVIKDNTTTQQASSTARKLHTSDSEHFGVFKPLSSIALSAAAHNSVSLRQRANDDIAVFDRAVEAQQTNRPLRSGVFRVCLQHLKFVVQVRSGHSCSVQFDLDHVPPCRNPQAVPFSA